MFPVDTVKTHMQALGSCPIKSVGVRQALTSILKSEGPLGLYRGIGAMGLGAGPAHAVYFSMYEICKKFFSRGNPNNSAAHAVSGVFATVASDTVFTPMDMVKQRLQLADSPYFGVWDCMKRVLREEGLRAFYASYRTTVLMNAPFTAVHFSTYEAAKKGLMEISPESANDERLVVHATAGALAGALAAFVTTPLDVVKTQLQCQVLSFACYIPTCMSVVVVLCFKEILLGFGAWRLVCVLILEEFEYHVKTTNYTQLTSTCATEFLRSVF